MTAAITVVGLGSGDESQLTLGIWNKLNSAARIYLRTEKHPVVAFLSKNNIKYQTFDALYEKGNSFPEVYEAIASELLQIAKQELAEIIYAVPGHPMVAEATVGLLRERCEEQSVELHVLGGESFLDQVFLRLGFDPIEGVQVLDGTSTISSALIHPEMHLIIAQVYNAMVASEVKLSLMEVYPDDYPVKVAHALGVDKQEQVTTVPLYELDRVAGYGNLSLIWVPRSDDDQLKTRSFARLQDIVRILRSPGGCPWDREQTHLSLRKNLIEETYEVLETLDDDDPVGMCEELGDLLLQVMMHSQIEEEAGAFNIRDVIGGLNEKLLRRHPHVFGDRKADNAAEALATWKDMKLEEKKAKGIDVGTLSVLAGIPRELPGLMKAWKLQKKAAGVGFDWDHVDEVADKVKEELQEVLEAFVNNEAMERQKEELGDLLFAVVNLARFLKADPEEAIAATNRKFVKRFSYIEEQLRLNGKTFDQTSLPEMETWWQEAKQKL